MIYPIRIIHCEKKGSIMSLEDIVIADLKHTFIVLLMLFIVSDRRFLPKKTDKIKQIVSCFNLFACCEWYFCV